MSVADKLKDEYGGQLDQLHISIRNNAQLAGLCWELIESAVDLNRTYRDNQTNNRLTERHKQARNLAYENIWRIFNIIVSVTEPHIREQLTTGKNREDNQKIIEESKAILKKTMAETDLRQLTYLALEYYNLLSRKGMFEISAKISGRGAFEKILTG